ncbi:hypothetical protein E4U42_003264 [Claviceps africana]|uniref:Aminoacyl-transfer RNA synthetases class-II family profile domain-containing protein n=1 Tax=Claviceps africana TaxID=83212 RepID=A0A8K0J6X1_9HYPO|nr:hypothetical protein E4U42_003264 [Claviceps africana]
MFQKGYRLCQDYGFQQGGSQQVKKKLGMGNSSAPGSYVRPNPASFNCCPWVFAFKIKLKLFLTSIWHQLRKIRPSLVRARKYRDEMRPRHGLLRSREFVMKDLYTFDTSFASAISTYREVAQAYHAFFADLKMPVLVAEASSGDMGGNHSHEYHLPSPVGEDTVISCDSCEYAANHDVATARKGSPSDSSMSNQGMQVHDISVWRGITKDRKVFINAWYPAKDNAGRTTEINIHAVKQVVADLDTSIDDSVKAWRESLSASTNHASGSDIKVINVVDKRLASSYSELAEADKLPIVPAGEQTAQTIFSQPPPITSHNGEALDLLRVMEGDGCPRCGPGQLRVQKALELGHTFYLGTRYSEPLGLSVTYGRAMALSATRAGVREPVPVEMGCYGIGMSRILGAVAEHRADERGLQWPRAIAPFEVVVIPTSELTYEMLDVYYRLTTQSAAVGRSGRGFDVVLDDREETFGWKMQDADLIGYPVIVVLGKAWRDQGICEVQCRSLSYKENIHVKNLTRHVASVLARL